MVHLWDYMMESRARMWFKLPVSFVVPMVLQWWDYVEVMQSKMWLSWASNATKCWKKDNWKKEDFKLQLWLPALQRDATEGNVRLRRAACVLRRGWSWHPVAECTVCAGQRYLCMPVCTIWKPLWKTNTRGKLFYMSCQRRDSINLSHVMDTLLLAATTAFTSQDHKI